MVDELIDTVKPGRPEALLMAKRTQAQAVQSSVVRRATLLETSLDAFGRHVISYDGIPVITDDWLPIDETQGTESGRLVHLGREVRLRRCDGLGEQWRSQSD